MKFVVLNGSPKGNISVTMQYVQYLQKKHSLHEFQIVNIAQNINQIENDSNTFEKIVTAINQADGVLWAFPLYIALVHSNYKRFIELINERNAQAAFKSKYAAILTTSIHFYDHTAHNYIHGICDDWSMHFYDTYSAKMYDLLEEEEQQKLLLFWQGFMDAVTRKIPTVKVFPTVTASVPLYTTPTNQDKVDNQKQKIVLVTDTGTCDINLNHMIETFVSAYTVKPTIINLQHLNIAGGCLGCINCGYDNTCVYEGKDDFIAMYNTEIKTADIIVFAGSIKDRYLSSLWKKFFDRAFFNTHIPSLQGKQLAFLISGPLSQLPNLREILLAYSEWQRVHLVNIITDEQADSRQTAALLHELAWQSVACAVSFQSKPPTYLGVGGYKIFRDEIWGHLQFPFVADYKFYKNKGFFDFPQKKYGERVRNFLLHGLVKLPFIRKKIYNASMPQHMIDPFQNIQPKE